MEEPNAYLENTINSLMAPCFQQARYVVASALTDRHRHTHKTSTITLVHAPRVKNIQPYPAHDQMYKNGLPLPISELKSRKAWCEANEINCIC